MMCILCSQNQILCRLLHFHYHCVLGEFVLSVNSFQFLPCIIHSANIAFALDKLITLTFQLFLSLVSFISQCYPACLAVLLYRVNHATFQLCQ